MGEDKTHKITLYNDDKLSFDYVTACLTQICGHTPIQAEQCAILASMTLSTVIVMSSGIKRNLSKE